MTQSDLQNAIDNGDAVRLIQGQYLITEPVRLTNFASIVGLGPRKSVIVPQFRGPAFYSLAPEQEAFDHGDADGWILDGSMARWLNLSQSQVARNLNGKNFYISFQFRRDQVSADPRTIVASGGALLNTLADYQSAFAIETIGGDIRVRFRSDGKHTTLTHNLPDLGEWVEVEYHHRNDGICTFRVGTQTQTHFTGPIQQAWHESLYLGSTPVRWPDNVCIQGTPVGRVKQLHIVVGTASVNLQLTDWSYKPFVLAGSTWGQDWLLPQLAGAWTPNGGHELHDFAIMGGTFGFFLSNAQNCRLSGLRTEHHTSSSIYLWNNSYSNTVENCLAVGSSGRIGIGCIAQGVLNTIEKCSVSHFEVPFLFNDGGGRIRDCFAYSGNMRCALIAKGDNIQLDVDALATGDEGQPPPYADASILFSSVEGGSIQNSTIWNGHQAGAPVWLDDADGVTIQSLRVHASHASELVKVTRPPADDAILMGVAKFGAGMEAVPVSLTPEHLRIV